MKINSYDVQLIHRCIQICMIFKLNERAKPEMSVVSALPWGSTLASLNTFAFERPSSIFSISSLHNLKSYLAWAQNSPLDTWISPSIVSDLRKHVKLEIFDLMIAIKCYLELDMMYYSHSTTVSSLKYWLIPLFLNKMNKKDTGLSIVAVRQNTRFWNGTYITTSSLSQTYFHPAFVF